MLFVWIVLLTVWLLIFTGAGTMKSLERVGQCENLRGGMTSNATAVLHSSIVSFSCWLNSSGLNSSQDSHQMTILQNGTKISSHFGLSISAHVSMHTFGMQTFECQHSRRRPKTLCGLYIYVGIPPDQPQNVVCIQYGKDGTTSCTWDKGNLTYLPTGYTLQLTNGTTNKTWFQEKEMYSMNDRVDLGIKLDFDSIYTAVVVATNELGRTSSLPIQFTLKDIVKPHPPKELLVECDKWAATNCTILWQDQQETRSFRLRYQQINSNSWTVLENIDTKRYQLPDLKPEAEYKFQVSCRFFPNQGLWSDWSMTFQTEAVPFGPRDVWYLKADISSQMQNVTLFWKGKRSKTRGKSYRYIVTFQTLNQKQKKAAETRSTIHTVFSQITPKADYRITVYSNNSRGFSLPAHITTELEIEDLLPPCNLSATSMDNNSIFVSWEAPLATSPFINGYVVEWAAFRQGHQLQTHQKWLKIPVSNSTAIIENLKHNVCYHIYVFALYRNRAGETAYTIGDVAVDAPLTTGPQINITVKEGTIFISCEEIPENRQMGCIAGYKIYLQKRFSTTGPQVYDIPKATPQPFSVKQLHPATEYTLWMTAITKAGESPKGNEEIFVIEKTTDWAPFLAMCFIMGLSTCVCCVPSARKMILSFLSAWYKAAIPDPANSSWAKKLTHVEDESSLHFNQLLNNFEEPEILQIEEVLLKRQVPIFQDVLLFENTENEGCHYWTRGSSFQEAANTMTDSTYNPSTTEPLHDTPIDKPQRLSLYKKVGSEEPSQGQLLPKHLANPLGSPAVDYLPSSITPTVMNTDEASSESEFNSFSVFPRTFFLSETFPFGGKLTLDAIRLDCSSFRDFSH